MQSIHISSDHWLPRGFRSPLLPFPHFFPLFVYHIEVDLCRLHLAELGGVGDLQQLKWSQRGDDEGGKGETKGQISAMHQGKRR